MHASFSSRLALLVCASVVLPSLAACLDHPLKEVEYEAQQNKGIGVPLAVNKDVDILFVVDNSGSMGEEQATLAANFASFIDVLERPKVSANYRIGVTTTDNGNPWCQGTGAEAGALQLSSCRSRPQSFVFDGAQPYDATEEACNAVCPEEWTDIEIQPTTLDGEGEAKPRNWIESIEGRTNLPEGLSTVQAFQCIGPQGINGCGFESPLESMWKALRRSTTADDPDFGFMREHAILSVIHVTDEADCSYNTEFESIFLPQGNRVFWSDQDAPSPTSAVCWNAGVACDGSDCRAVNLDVDGNEVADDEANALAVLRPTSRYTELLQNLEDEKKRISPEQELLVAIIGGVNDDGSVTYQDSLSDPDFQRDFGIGPGCESSSGRAVPPVRLRELADAFKVGEDQNMFSICNSDYSDALEAIAKAIADQVEPTCMPACVGDSDPSTDALDPSCVLLQDIPDGEGSSTEVEVPPCEANDAVPDGHDVCYTALTGDERSKDCVNAGFNLEFRIERREGAYVAPGTGIRATCELSQNKAVECPELP